MPTRPLDDLGRIFADLVPLAGERVPRDFVWRLKAADVGLATLSERGSLHTHVWQGLRIVGYRRQASITLVVPKAEVFILRVFRRGADTETLLTEGGGFGAADAN